MYILQCWQILCVAHLVSRISHFCVLILPFFQFHRFCKFGFDFSSLDPRIGRAVLHTCDRLYRLSEASKPPIQNMEMIESGNVRRSLHATKMGEVSTDAKPSNQNLENLGDASKLEFAIFGKRKLVVTRATPRQRAKPRLQAHGHRLRCLCNNEGDA